MLISYSVMALVIYNKILLKSAGKAKGLGRGLIRALQRLIMSADVHELLVVPTHCALISLASTMSIISALGWIMIRIRTKDLENDN